MIDLQQIVELGKRATKRPYALDVEGNRKHAFITGGAEDGRLFCAVSLDDRDKAIAQNTARYLVASANSADIMAQQLLDLRKLCERAYLSAPVGSEIVKCISVEEVKAILERQA